MEFPKVISVYSRTSSAGKRSLALNLFLTFARMNPGTRIFVVDFTLTEKLNYSLQKYGKSHFLSTDFITEISDDILVNESLLLHRDSNEGSFLRVLPSAGCQVKGDNLPEKVKHRVNSLFFKNIIDLLVFILPMSLEEDTITMAALLESELVWFLSTGKYPSINLTKTTVQSFFNFLTVPTLLILNMIHPPMILGRFESFLKDFENKMTGPVFYCIPWLQELFEFSDKGVFLLEHPDSKVTEVFLDFTEKFIDAVELQSLEVSQDALAPSPQALFMTERYSGSTLYYHFFGKSEDEMQNPALITAALSSIAHMISETAGRKGDLRGIDNRNSYIDFKYGDKIIGILYSTAEESDLSDLLLRFTNKFERQFESAIADFSKTGKTGPFSDARNLLNEIFRDWMFDIKTVNAQLRYNILSFQSKSKQLRIDPEEAFQNYVKENLMDQNVLGLLYYEFTTSHNSRHDFLLELGINPRKEKRKIEEETGKSLCLCTEPPKYVQIQGFDALGLLNLPEKLRPTARALFASKTLSPESAAKITHRTQEEELNILEELRKLGYVRKVTSDY